MVDAAVAELALAEGGDSAGRALPSVSKPKKIKAKDPVADEVKYLTSEIIAEASGVPKEEHEMLEELEVIFSSVNEIGEEVWTRTLDACLLHALLFRLLSRCPPHHPTEALHARPSVGVTWRLWSRDSFHSNPRSNSLPHR